jgi:hypothetical protein
MDFETILNSYKNQPKKHLTNIQPTKGSTQLISSVVKSDEIVRNKELKYSK